MQLQILPHVWQPMSVERADEIQARMLRVLEGWAGTKYLSGQRCKGVGVDCIGFVFGLIDELDGKGRASFASIPSDAALHSKVTAYKAVVALRRTYSPAIRLRKAQGSPMALEPGDLLVVGTQLGGPGHLMIVGPRKNTIWHAMPGSQVAQCGWCTGDGYERVFAVYRLLDRDAWLTGGSLEAAE
jgi:cell wall-associated NlpC family hydrolase